MNKLSCVIYAPVDTFSGYGSHARSKAKSIINLYKDKWDIKIISCGWGSCSAGFIEENPEWSFLNEYILEVPQLNFQPDIMIWLTVPNEVRPVGKWNCLITAGLETTLVPSEWINGVNQMDLTIVSSEHSKTIFEHSKYDQINKQTQQKEGELALTKPVEVCLEGMDINIFKPLDKVGLDLSNVKEDFAYLFCGQWVGNAPIGEDRKNIGLLIKVFLETFKNKKNKPALILKTSLASSSYVERDEIIKRIKLIKGTVDSKDLPNIYVLMGEFSDEEINELYNHPKVKAMISLTKGEGFGRPLLEFTSTKKPIITTKWSGQLDFLNPEFTNLIEGQLTPVHPAAANNMLLKESMWFSPDLIQTNFYLTDVFENYNNYLEKAKRQAYRSKTEFSLEKMDLRIKELFDKYIPNLPVKMELKLPQLQRKLELPKLVTIEK